MLTVLTKILYEILELIQHCLEFKSLHPIKMIPDDTFFTTSLKYTKSTDTIEGDATILRDSNDFVWIGSCLPKQLCKYRLIILRYKIASLWGFDNVKDNKIWKRRYKILLAANVKDEKNIVEWTEWHLDIGFNHIYIADDDSTIPVSSLIYDTRVSIDVKTDVKKAYIEDSIIYARKHGFDFIMYLDGDEYLYIPDRDLHFFLYRFPKTTIGICFHWLMFGSNGHDIGDTSNLVKMFTRSCNRLNDHVKTLAKVKYIKGVYDPHAFKFSTLESIFTADGRLVTDYRGKITPFPEPFDVRSAYIAHYFLQTREEYLRRKIRRARDDDRTFRSLSEEGFILDAKGELDASSFHRRYNDIENTTLLYRQRRLSNRHYDIYTI